MKKIVLLSTFIGLTLNSNAQAIDRSVIGSNGTYLTHPNAQVSFTLGETAIQYLSASGAIVRQGFQQNNNNTTGIKNYNNLGAKLNISQSFQ